MPKSLSLKTLFLCSLALGSVLSFSLFSGQQEEISSDTSASRGEFIAGHKSASSPRNNNPSLFNPDLLLQKYETFSAEQIKTELLSLLKWERLMPTPDFQKTMLIDYLACKLGEKEREGIVSFAGALGNVERERLLPCLMQGWGKSDFDSAANHLLENRQNILSLDNILGKLSRDIALADPEKAFLWGISQQGGVRKHALQSIKEVLSATRPEELPRYLEKITPEDLEDGVLGSLIARNWAARDWDSAKKWIQSLPEPQNSAASTEAFRSLAQCDSEKATHEFLLWDKGDNYLFASAIASDLVSRSPLQTMDWVITHSGSLIAAQSLMKQTLSCAKNKFPKSRNTSGNCRTMRSRMAR